MGIWDFFFWENASADEVRSWDWRSAEKAVWSLFLREVGETTETGLGGNQLLISSQGGCGSGLRLQRGAMLLPSRVCRSGMSRMRGGDEMPSVTLEVRLCEDWAACFESAAIFQRGSGLDDLACAFVSVGTLKRLAVLGGKWVGIRSSTSDGLNPKGRMLVRLIACDLESLKDGQVVLNPVIMFNLGLALEDGEESKDKDSSRMVVQVRRADFLMGEDPPVAKSVTIARVRSPESSGHAEYGPALREFFKVPRMVRKNDVIAIPIPVEMALEGVEDNDESALNEDELELMPSVDDRNREDDIVNNGANKPHWDEKEKETTDELMIVDDAGFLDNGQKIRQPHEIVYFKVTELNGPDDFHGMKTENMLVDGIGGKTMLTQAGAVNSHIPDTQAVLEFHFPSGRPQEIKKLSSTNDAEENFLRALKAGSNPTLLEHLKRFSIIIYGGKGTGKRRMVNLAGRRLGFHVFEQSLTPLRGLPEDRAAKKLKQILIDGVQVAPCIIHLRNLHALAPTSRGSEQPAEPEQVASVLRNFSNPKVIIAASTVSVEDVPTVIRGCFTHEIAIEAPDKDARLEILEHLTANKIRLAGDVSLESLAVKTAGRTANDLRALFANAACAVALQPPQSESSPLEAAWNESIGGSTKAMALMELSQKVIDEALESLPSAAAMDIGAPKIPQVYWDDVGGLAHAKDEILDMVQLPLQHPELFAAGVRQRSGILLYGPPGTGKTLLAKAVATECNLNFISVKGPELLDMYIGESERKVRQVFETARSAKPCVLFFDELDSLAPQRGRGADSGGVMDRVVSQLLTEIDGMQGSSDVFVIGATNRPDLLDQSLLRPGRFDRLIYLGISRDRAAQLKIVKALTRKYAHDEDVDLNDLVERCPFNFTGADFYALCSGAMANALQRRVKEIQVMLDACGNKDMTVRKLLASMKEEDLQVTVKMLDYNEALKDTVPSVSEDEIRHYQMLRDKFSSSKSRKQREVDGHHDEEKEGPIMNGHSPESTIVKCPKCATPTIKEGGCDEVTCAVCSNNYGWGKQIIAKD